MHKHSFQCAARYTGLNIRDGGVLTIVIDGRHRVTHAFKGYGEAFDCADKVRLHLNCPLRETQGLAESILLAIQTAREAHLSLLTVPVEVSPCIGLHP